MENKEKNIKADLEETEEEIQEEYTTKLIDCFSNDSNDSIEIKYEMRIY